jgi:phosphoribosyl-ATP pyrophosphohydrolase
MKNQKTSGVFSMNDKSIFNRLFEVIESRKKIDPEESYVSSLFSKGTEKINSKILEEAEEVCEASIENDKNHLTYEICDLMFHLFVLSSFKEIKLSEIETELERRFGKSGLLEKKERGEKK